MNHMNSLPKIRAMKVIVYTEGKEPYVYKFGDPETGNIGLEIQADYDYDEIDLGLSSPMMKFSGQQEYTFRVRP